MKCKKCKVELVPPAGVCPECGVGFPGIGLGGWLSLVAFSALILWGGYSLFFGSANYHITLGEFRELSESKRIGVVAAAMEEKGFSAEFSESYLACMGEFAYEKSPDLAFVDVIGWCETERKNNFEKFSSHYDELRFGDLKTYAFSACRTHIASAIKREAEFPLLDWSHWRKARQKYVIKSYLEVLDGLGNKVKINWHCEVQYQGEGKSFTYDKWKLLELSL